MDQNLTKRNELLAQTVIKGLGRRNIKAEYAATREEALQERLRSSARARPSPWAAAPARARSAWSMP